MTPKKANESDSSLWKSKEAMKIQPANQISLFSASLARLMIVARDDVSLASRLSRQLAAPQGPAKNLCQSQLRLN